MKYDKGGLDMWIITNKGDQDCRRLADRHYTRQKVGSVQFCRPGRNLVLRTADGKAVWVTWNGKRDDGLDCWECTLFRNETDQLSSGMIQAAVQITISEWGPLPSDGLVTFVAPGRVASPNPGYCFKMAGFRSFGRSKTRGHVRLQYG